ncbi:hypothetical protein BDN72DRAFT_962435 [Pluteus cervinus]|uniref:Uncharacterized protein n=1 Tax=Pluteus cervinus TaxID=181527 RepID=A0ACD3AJI3_9AGAR|nr:hypothetical protein BDN72DRAFT_962435 [Pluteus cervinus]
MAKRSRVPRQKKVDLATTLPAELWLHIFELLTIRDIQGMMMVHRVFYNYSCPFMWRSLVLYSRESKHQTQVRAIMRNLTFGQHVMELHLRPILRVRELNGKPFSPLNPLPSVRVSNRLIRTPQVPDVPYSQAALSTALAVLPHLTRLRTLWVSTWLSSGDHPSPEPYRILWSNLPTNNLTSVAFTFSSWAPLKLISEAICDSQVSFPCLETLDLHSFVEPHENCDSEPFERSIRVIADAGRNSLKSLRLALFPHDNRPPPSRLFSGIGLFPNLVHFDFTAFHCKDDILVTAFLGGHHSTLKKLNIRGFAHQLFPCLHLAETKASRSMKLTSLGFQYQTERRFSPWSFGGEPSLRAYADSLTTLSFSPAWILPDFQCAFKHEDLCKVVSSLYRPSGALLQRLRIPVEYLCPEFFDLLSHHLVNLHTLDIAHRKLVTHVGSMHEAPHEFWQEMKKRTYPNWKVERFSLVDALYWIPCWPVLGDEQKQIMKHAIPSIKAFGDCEWQDLEVNVPMPT